MPVGSSSDLARLRHLRETALAAAGLGDQHAGAHDRRRQAALARSSSSTCAHRGQRPRIERASCGGSPRARRPSAATACCRRPRRTAASDRRVAQVAIQVERRAHVFGEQLLALSDDRCRRARCRRLALHHPPRCGQRPQQRILVRQRPVLDAQRMEVAQQPSRTIPGVAPAHERPREQREYARSESSDSAATASNGFSSTRSYFCSARRSSTLRSVSVTRRT